MNQLVKLSIEGFQFQYRRLGPWGQNTPIFFISGAFQDMAAWKKLEDYFTSRQIPVLLADLPGTGDADLLPPSYGIDFLADAASRVIRDASDRPVHIMAASYGAPIAYRCAERNPDQVSSLIMAGIMKEIPDHVRPAVEQNLRTLQSGDLHRFAREGIEKGLLCRDPQKPVDKRRLSERVIYRILSRMPIPAQRRYVANTRRLLVDRPLKLGATHSIRTLVFTGEHDTFTRPEYCREVAETIPRCWFTTIRRADHLVHLQQFEATARLIYEFILGNRLQTEQLTPVERIGYRMKTVQAAPPLGDQAARRTGWASLHSGS